MLLRSPRQTHHLGQRLGALLRGGEVLALCGELGTGKTSLVRGIAEGLDAVIVNPSIIIGKNSRTGSIQFFDLIKRGFPFHPTGTCGIVDVEDVAKAMIMLMESDITGERFIVNSENRTFRGFFEEIAHNYCVKPPSIAVKPWMLMLAVPIVRFISLLTGKKPALTPETARSAFQKRGYSNAPPYFHFTEIL